MTILSISESNTQKKNRRRQYKMSNSRRIKQSPSCISVFPIIELPLFQLLITFLPKEGNKLKLMKQQIRKAILVLYILFNNIGHKCLLILRDPRKNISIQLNMLIKHVSHKLGQMGRKKTLASKHDFLKYDLTFKSI